MLRFANSSRTFQLFVVLLFANACGDGGSNDPDGGTGGNCSSCDDDSYCVNKEGSFACQRCPAGYELDGNECVDIDECATDTDSCDEHASCENSEGTYECSCDEGFSGDGEECTDIDECEEGIAACDDELECVNDEGSFSCEPCAAGYALDGDACVDIDECATDADSCDDNASCENTEGSHECTCDAGFEGDGQECADIDECAEGSDDCDDDSYCANKEGSFSCEPCPAGYELDGDVCVDIDECAVDNGGCGDLTAGTCENSEGSFACLCNDGYLLAEDTCVYTVPTVVASTPLQGAVDVYPSEFFIEPGYGNSPSGSGIRERIYVDLTFDMEMNTDEATVVVTDEAGLEEPRTFEGTWDETGYILTAIILPHDDANPPVALYDETTYRVSFEDLESSYGTPVDPEDAEFPGAQLTFTTGVRIGVLNHACFHVASGPFVAIDASADPGTAFTDFSTPHTHYTFNLPPGEEGGPNVGHSLFFPNLTETYLFYLSDPGSLQIEFAPLDPDTFLPTPFAPLEIVGAPPACHTVRAPVKDPDTGEVTLAPAVAGITHFVSTELDENEFYSFKFSSTDSVTYTIVESDSSF